MRTTLTLDPDVAQKLQERMTRRKETLKEAINRALRDGLASEQLDVREQFVVEGHACGFLPGIDRDKMNQLADELEVEEFLNRQSR